MNAWSSCSVNHKDKKERVKEHDSWRNEGERNKITKHKLEKLREIGQKERNLFQNIPDHGEVDEVSAKGGRIRWEVVSSHRSQKEWAGGEGSKGRVLEGRDSG